MTFVFQQNVGTDTLSGTMLQEKVGTIYDHPITQYEWFIERYYGTHKGSGKCKVTVISDVYFHNLNFSYKHTSYN